MANYTYIKKDAKDYFVNLDEQLNPEFYSNIGETWDDYQDYMWVLLSSEQKAFHEEHPEASVYEVWNMQLNQRTLAQAKNEMLYRIDAYDRSSSVNGFTVNNTMEAWITADERSDYRSSIDAAKLLSIETLVVYVNDLLMELTPTQAEYMLAQIQLYANACFIVTKQHKLAVENLTTIEEVDAYPYMTGYPERLNFNYPEMGVE